jgi:hypothetical protein
MMYRDENDHFAKSTNKQMLNQIDAEALVLARLRSRSGGERIRIVDSQTVERPFGWVFTLAEDVTIPANESQINFPQQVILNKHSEQLVACSIEHSQDQFIRLYEKLLAKSQARARSWCLTITFPFPWGRWWKGSVAETAKETGFYEIGGKEIER